jgi:ATP-dependent DNA ligase
LKKHGEPLSVTAYSRNRKPILSAGAICGRLYPYLNALYDTANKHSIYLDGELYIHGKSLQEISGNARQHLATDQQYHIYDCFYPDELQTPFADRLKQLQEIQRTLTQEDQQYIKFVDTRLINNRAEMLEQYRKFTSAKYEGAIVRNCLAPYLASSTKTSSALRSPDLIKIKPLFTDEFKCIGYTDGKRGRDAGAIIWQCMTANKIVFNVTPKLDYAERYRLFAECEEYTNQHGKFKYHDQPLTVEYQDLSKTGVPLRAKSVVFRTYE